jgi:hypothetical protein
MKELKSQYESLFSGGGCCCIILWLYMLNIFAVNKKRNKYDLTFYRKSLWWLRMFLATVAVIGNQLKEDQHLRKKNSLKVPRNCFCLVTSLRYPHTKQVVMKLARNLELSLDPDSLCCSLPRGKLYAFALSCHTHHTLQLQCCPLQ